MRRKSLILIAMVVITSIGCISAPVKEAHSSTLRIGYQPSTHQIAEMVAQEKGWWMHDLLPFGVTDIKEYEFPSGPPEAHAMMAGDLDIAYIGTSPLVAAISNGLDAKIVAGVNVNGSDLILRPDLPYNGPSSLAGMTIGTFPQGSVQDMVLRKWLSDSGVDLSSVRIRYMGPGDGVSAMFSRRVDGGLPACTLCLIA
ncbi:MAG TPA: ABC transporter substrate-binding protein [Methanotrichaceae archaeon]|nr:ABC transporter substrate-binding protein [Methanotrichaceae archaeon]